MPGKRVDHYDPGVLGKYRGHSIIHDDGTVEHFTNNGSLADGVTDGRYVGRSVIRKGESRVQRTRQGGGSSGGGGLGEALGGGLLLLLLLGPFYAAYLLLKGLVLSVLNRSVAPLLEWTTGACGVMALWSGVYALLWYAGLRLGKMSTRNRRSCKLGGGVTFSEKYCSFRVSLQSFSPSFSDISTGTRSSTRASTFQPW